MESMLAQVDLTLTNYETITKALTAYKAKLFSNVSYIYKNEVR